MDADETDNGTGKNFTVTGDGIGSGGDATVVSL